MHLNYIMNFTVRFSFFILFLFASSYAQEINTDTNDTNISTVTTPDTNTTEDKDNQEVGPVIIKDTSGLTNEEIRKKADKADTKSKKLKIKDVVEAIDDSGRVHLKKLVDKNWEDLSPTPKNGFDWIKTKYGDWLVGHIRSYYKDEFEFDSKEFGIYTFKLADLSEIRSFDVMQVNIDNAAIIKGIIRYKDNKIKIISGDNTYEFDKDMIISITTAKDKEIYKWAGDISLNLDVRKGNNDQADYSLKANIQRRTPKHRFNIDYLGRYSRVRDTKTAEDNRINVKYDKFLTRRFFITPIFGEFYENYFQNIRSQVIVGAGIGYSIYNTNKLKWDITAGPAYMQTKFYEVKDGINSLNDKSFAFEANSKYEFKINPLNKVKIDYKFTLSDENSGSYKHHSILKFENDLVKDKIYIDTSLIWDYVAKVQETNDIVPKNSDFQLLVGGGIKF